MERPLVNFIKIQPVDSIARLKISNHKKITICVTQYDKKDL